MAARRLPLARISAIVNGRRGISAGTALRLARYFNTSAQFWLNLQTAYELEVTERAEAAEIRREVRPLQQVPTLASGAGNAPVIVQVLLVLW